MKITATEFKRNLGSYLERSKDELIVITQYGKPVAKLSGIGGSPRLIDKIAGTMPLVPDADEGRAGRVDEACAS